MPKDIIRLTRSPPACQTKYGNGHRTYRSWICRQLPLRYRYLIICILPITGSGFISSFTALPKVRKKKLVRTILN
jgi:hypothetical protein